MNPFKCRNDETKSAPIGLSTSEIWLHAICYGYKIYSDKFPAAATVHFPGASDMNILEAIIHMWCTKVLWAYGMQTEYMFV